MEAASICTASLLAVLFLQPCGAALMNYKCKNGRSYTPNTTYQSNVARLLSNLSAYASNSTVGFAIGAVGSAPDEAWGVALCRGDTNGASCASCLAPAPDDAFNKCRGVNDFSIFYDRCILRYSNQDFLDNPDNRQVLMYGPSKENITNHADRFDGLVSDLVGALSDWAAFNATSRYAAGVMSSDEGFLVTTLDVAHNISGVVQCTPDQTPEACRACLEAVKGDMPAVFNGRAGGQINAVWCNLRYEVYDFYDGNPTVRLVAPPPEKGSRRRGSGNAAVVIAIVLGVIVIVLSMSTVYLWRKAKTKQSSLFAEESEDAGSLLFDLRTLRQATANFAEVNKLGDGGFGAVYKGFLPDGKEIAVKRLSKTSEQGLKELKNELVLVAKLRHNNLAKLLGVCLQEQERLLVYEYLPNRSLDTFLFESEKRELLEWETRYNIIYGTARGLLYLHEDSQMKIVHRDLKASNILLDADMNPKISDFGLARLFRNDQSNTITSHVVGTLGYMAPEYAVLGHLSVKLDVYSFGVLVMEILTGRRNTDVFESVEEPNTLLSYAWSHWTKGTPLEIMDPLLSGRSPEGEVLKCIHLALLCVQENPADRPTMLSALVMLHSDTASFAAPSKPAFAFANSEVNSRANQVSVNEMSITEFHPR